MSLSLAAAPSTMRGVTTSKNCPASHTMPDTGALPAPHLRHVQPGAGVTRAMRDRRWRNSWALSFIRQTSQPPPAHTDRASQARDTFCHLRLNGQAM
eukprot:7391239-Pyramimonas_sp.AAC.1